jgi:hypothetical protein
MADAQSERFIVTLAGDSIEGSLAYPDGSRAQLVMPKPSGADEQAADQLEATARRMAIRLLGVSLEDLKTAD